MKHDELVNTIFLAVTNMLSNTHTATIGRVVSVSEKTIDVQPVISRLVNNKQVDLPIFQQVPPIFLGGGNSSLTMPISEDDYCLLIFTERCFDRWWNGQDNLPPLEMRMHDYSDGFALVGLQNSSGALTIPSDMTFTGDLIIDGNLNVTGDVIATGDVVAGGVSLKNHTHPYSWTGSSGSGTTGGPI